MDEDFANRVAEITRENRVWHLILGCVGLISVGLILLVAMGIALIAASGPDPLASGIGALMYGGIGFIYAIPTAFLLRSGMSASKIFDGSDKDAILASLTAQRWFWRIATVLTTSMFLLYLGMMLLFVVGLAFLF